MKQSPKSFSVFQLIAFIVLLSVLIVIVSMGIIWMYHSIKQTQVIRDLKTMEVALRSYYIFSHPNTFPPSSKAVTENFLTKTFYKKINKPMYDPMAMSMKTEYGYQRSANQKYYLIYSKGLNGIEGDDIKIDNKGKVTGLDYDDMCVTNGQGCDEYSCCNGVCAPAKDLVDCKGCAKCSVEESCVEGLCCPAEGSFNANCYGECVNTLTDSNNCGGCDTVCPSNTICYNGACSCPFSKCDGKCFNFQIDDNNCGGCGHVCPDYSKCSAGQCVCDTKDDIICRDQCVNPKTDNNNCGDCENVCTTNSKCSDGNCVCPYTICDDGCIDTQIDNKNCGACGNVCETGTCVGGVCCAAGYGYNANCNGTCMNLLTDSNNCGRCGRVCSSGESCVKGVCK